MFTHFSSSGLTYFAADTEALGNEPYVTDGTALGTVMLADINVGTGHSDPFSFTELPGVGVFFIADDAGAAGRELWLTNGTAAGTAMLKDIRPGTSDSFPSFPFSTTSSWADPDLTVLGTKVYFFANDGTNGIELWESDGTALGTVLVLDFRPGASSSYSSLNSGMAVFQGKIWFGGDDGTNGGEPTVYDPVLGTMAHILDINVGFSSVPAFFTVLGSHLYFRASDGPAGGTGFELWRTDGTALARTIHECAVDRDFLVLAGRHGEESRGFAFDTLK